MIEISFSTTKDCRHVRTMTFVTGSLEIVLNNALARGSSWNPHTWVSSAMDNFGPISRENRHILEARRLFAKWDGQAFH